MNPTQPIIAPQPRPIAGWLLAMLLTLAPTAGSAEGPVTAAAVARAELLIAVNPLLQGYPIEVEAQDGRLRLLGTVSNAVEREHAEALAALAAGLTSPPGTETATIVNDLSADAEATAAAAGLYAQVQDLDAQARLAQRLRWQVSNAGLDVSIEVENAAARLHGQVGASGIRDRLVRLAETTVGIERVFDYLVIDPGRRATERDAQAARAAERHDDDWIAARLRQLLRFDSTVNDRTIEIAVRNGQVRLRGTVTALVERQVVEEIAGDCPGVREVDSLLTFEHPL